MSNSTTTTAPTHIPRWTGTDQQAEDWIKNGLTITDKKTKERLIAEGVKNPADLYELDKDSLTALNNAMSSKVYADDGSVTAKPCPLNWRQLKRLKHYATLVEYLSITRRDITSAIVSWEDVVRDFTDQWKLLDAKKETDPGDVSLMKNGTPMSTHLRRIDNHLNDEIGALGCTREYITWSSTMVDSTPPAQAPPLLPNKLYAAGRNSIEDEMKYRISRDDHRAKQDDEALFNDLVTSLKGTQYEGLTAQFRTKKEGSKFHHLLKTTHGHNEILEAEFDKHKNWLESSRWSGKPDGEFVNHLDKTRAQLTSMKEIAESCPNVTLPTERQLVKMLLDSVTCKEAEMVAYKAQVKMQDGIGEDYRNDFEKAMGYLATAPYEGKGKPTGRKRARFADVSGATGGSAQNDDALDDEARYQASLKLNGGVGKTNVELRYHKAAEFKKLTKAQRRELLEWRERELVKLGLITIVLNYTKQK